MTNLFLLSKSPMARISPCFPLSHGVPRVDDRRVVSGIIYVIRNGLQWKDAPKAYRPHKTLYNRFVRWSALGVFDRIFQSLASEGPKPDRIMIDSTYDTKLYRQRSKIEIMFGRLKDWRRIAMRYDRCAHTFFFAICLAASVIFWV